MTVWFEDSEVGSVVADKRLSSKPGTGVMKRKMEILSQRGAAVHAGTFATPMRCKASPK